MNSRLCDSKSGMLQRIIEGSLTLDNKLEIENLLEIYPNEPILLRLYADLLSKSKLTEKSISVYDQAATLFIEKGMNLQAIVAKILQWSIRKPTHAEGRRFHSLLHEEGARHTPLQRFWSRMTYPELVAIMLRLVRTRLPAGRRILCANDKVEYVYFVVSGTLSEAASPRLGYDDSEKGSNVEPISLGPNDIFGDIFPLDQQTISHVEIRSISETELVKITKKVLKSACRSYPRIEELLRELHKSERDQKSERAWQTVRRTTRFGFPIQVDVIGHSAARPDITWRHTGIALDLSLGGMSVDLVADSPPQGCGEIKGQIVQIFIDLHNETTMNFSGVVVWHRKQTDNDRITNLIGIRFDPLSPGNRQLLTDYCSANSGEQNLLWSLWDTMVKVDNL